VLVRKPHQPMFGQARVKMANKDEHSRFIQELDELVSQRRRLTVLTLFGQIRMALSEA